MTAQLTLLPGDDDLPYHKRVYFGLGLNKQVKIGLTGRQNGRRGGEMHFEELCSVPGDKTVEDEYHRRYADERIGPSEWFRLSWPLFWDLYDMCEDQDRTRSIYLLRYIVLEREWPDAA